MNTKVFTVVLEVTIDEDMKDPKDWDWGLIQDKVLFVDSKRRKDIEGRKSKAI